MSATYPASMERPARRIAPLRYLLPWSPAGVPRAMWVQLRWLRFPAYLLAAADAAYVVFLLAPLWLGRGVGDLPCSLFLVAVALTVGIERLAARTLRRFLSAVQDADFRHCLECGYCLRGLPDRHACPECGVAYEITAVRGAWREWLWGR